MEKESIKLAQRLVSGNFPGGGGPMEVLLADERGSKPKGSFKRGKGEHL